ncbi:MAG: outer membrane protein assembly factor BamE [Gammaproteobacteria bacterium]
MPITRFFRRLRRVLPGAILGAMISGAVLGVAGCSYKSEIRQGSDTLPEKIAELYTGMTRTEVLELLGANRVPAVFADDEWIYYYRRRSPGFLPQTETWGIRLVFDGEILDEIRPLAAPGAAAEFAE